MASRYRQEIKRPDQFITQNFDLDWRGYSYGIQADVDHFAAARALDIAGIDIYHPSQDAFTGAEIAFGDDLARSMRGGQNFLVIETQAQGFPNGRPIPARFGSRRTACLRQARTWSPTGIGQPQTTE